MSVVALKRASGNPIGVDFAAHAASLPGAGLAWLDVRRAKAMEAFSGVGVPGRRDEEWKYTDLASALEDGFPSAAHVEGIDAGASPFPMSPRALRLSVADGFLQRPIPTSDDMEIVDLGALDARTPDWVRDGLGRFASGSEQPMGAASLALMRGGVAVRIRRSAALHLDFLHHAAASTSHARVLVLIEESASLRLYESHRGAGGGLSNLGMELVLQAGARLDHIRLQAEGAEALHVTSLGVSLARDAQYRALYVATGAKLSRLDAHMILGGDGAYTDLRSVAVPSSAIADVTTLMNHAAPHTASRQLFKSVVSERGRAVMQGRVRVREGAVKSDSHQLFKALLLSAHAEADAKPELEIFADDVACGHGTAIGALDDDALFYLRSRGIPEHEARGLLIRAFLDETMDSFAEDDVRAALWRFLDAALGA